MQRIIQDSARWALAGLVIGTALAILVAVAMGLDSQAILTLVIIAGGVGMCLGPPALIIRRAGQTAGAGRLVRGALWGGVCGLVLGFLYWFFYDDSFPLWHLVLPVALLAACGLINAALNVYSEARIGESGSIGDKSKPAAK